MAGMCLALVASCDLENRVYHQARSVSQKWAFGDTLEFELPILSHEASFDMFVDIRYTEEYLYRNLHLLVRHNIEDSLHWRTDTLCCQLRNEAGYPIGKGFAGLYQLEMPLATLVSDGSSCTRVQIMHYMAGDSLVGVTDVGLKLQSSQLE